MTVNAGTRRGAERPKVYDSQQRQAAAAIGRNHAPRWVVWWGLWSRRFYAVPTWQGAPVSIVEGRTVGELRAAMSAAEPVTVPARPVRTPSGRWGRQ